MSAAENVLYCSNDSSAWISFARRSLLKAPNSGGKEVDAAVARLRGEAWLLLLACVNGLAPTAPLAMDILQVRNRRDCRALRG